MKAVAYVALHVADAILSINAFAFCLCSSAILHHTNFSLSVFHWFKIYEFSLLRVTKQIVLELELDVEK